MHGKNSKGKPSDYSKQLREKQKARRIFGISEKQMQHYYKEAVSAKEESGIKLIEQMERRLDNTIFRTGFATTRRQARQFVSHGLFMLNGQRVKTPSIQVNSGDVLTVRAQSKSIPFFHEIDKRKPNTPKWLVLDPVALEGKVVGKPDKDDLEGSIDPQMIIEFYSR